MGDSPEVHISSLFPAIRIKTLDDAQTWLNVMHRRSVADAEQIAALYDRIEALNVPWWRRWRRVNWRTPSEP